IFLILICLLPSQLIGQTISDGDFLNKPSIEKSSAIGFVQIVRFKSTLPDSVVFGVIEKRKVEFLKVPGLVQKYYLRDPKTMEFCGVYMWASEQDFLEFKKTDLSKSSAQAYQIDGTARVELYNMIYPLR
ncbi:MAG: hypothetical protein ACKOKB_06780, partial [Bacteroidota bacterium]